MTDLGIPENKEILYATWEKGDLVRKKPTPSAFLEHLQTCLKKWISHNYIRRIQGKAISKEKSMQKASVLLHLNFAENWTVKLPDEIQSHHWSKSEVTIFTCVATTQKGAHSFAVISDDMGHDSAHACYAVAKVHEWLEEYIAVYAYITYVSDGAAAHFKNKFQIHELINNRYASAKCLFCFTGHGKNDCDGIGGIVKHQATLYNLRNLICHQLCFRYGASSDS